MYRAGRFLLGGRGRWAAVALTVLSGAVTAWGLGSGAFLGLTGGLLAADGDAAALPGDPNVPADPNALADPNAPVDPAAPDADAAVPAGPGAPLAAEAPKPIQESRPGTFNVNLMGTDVRLALRLLGTQSRKNIIATKEVAGTVTADLYEVTFKEALEAILHSSGYVYVEKGDFLYVMTPKQMEESQKALREPKVRVYRLAYVRPADARALVAPALSDDGSVEMTPAAVVGISTSKIDTGGDSYGADGVLIVRDYEENLRQVDEIIAQIDTRPEQVLIEATILRATLNEDTALGIDFNTLAGIDFQTLNSSSNGLKGINTGTIDGASLPNARPAAGIQTNLNAGIQSNGGITVGFIANEAAFFIRALDEVTDIAILANPKLLVVNKQRGEVMVGNRDGYLTTTVTETTATETVEFLETGTKLVVRPFIGRDGYVRMELHPADSSGSVRPVGASVLPSESTTEVTSNVIVRDGHTIVIGGLFRERTDKSRGQVPLLGDLPYVGAAFRRTSDATVREEVIILITPRIIRSAPDEAVSALLKDDVERFRLGMRKGLHWWSRARMAQYHLRKAKENLREGERDDALWHVDKALALEPRMIDAIRLKECITEKAYWADDAQYSSARNLIERMMMNEMGLPLETATYPNKPRDPRDLAPEVREALGLEPLIEAPLPCPPDRLVPSVRPTVPPMPVAPAPPLVAPDAAPVSEPPAPREQDEPKVVPEEADELYVPPIEPALAPVSEPTEVQP